MWSAVRISILSFKYTIWKLTTTKYIFSGIRINAKRFMKINVELSTQLKWKKGAKMFQKLNVESPMNVNVSKFLKNNASWSNSRLINNIAKMFLRDIAGKKFQLLIIWSKYINTWLWSCKRKVNFSSSKELRN